MLKSVISLISLGDLDVAVEVILDFLKAAPMCTHSGFYKELVIA